MNRCEKFVEAPQRVNRRVFYLIDARKLYITEGWGHASVQYNDTGLLRRTRRLNSGTKNKVSDVKCQNDIINNGFVGRRWPAAKRARPFSAIKVGIWALNRTQFITDGRSAAAFSTQRPAENCQNFIFDCFLRFWPENTRRAEVGRRGRSF